MTAPGPIIKVYEKKHFNKVALIDADRIKHLVCYNIYQDLQMNYPREKSKTISYIEDRLESLFNTFSASSYLFCFSGKSYQTFRNEISFERKYKGNRTDNTYYEGKIDDMVFVIDYISKQYPTLIYKDLEADDVISMLQNENTFVFSNDKDLLQIPGYHYNEEEWDLIYISEEEAFRNLMVQLIKGDGTDNIQGLPGYGQVKSESFVTSSNPNTIHFKILNQYQKKYGFTKGIDVFCEMWMLVKLRMNRGSYFKEKYSGAFKLLETLTQNL